MHTQASALPSCLHLVPSVPCLIVGRMAASPYKSPVRAIYNEIDLEAFHKSKVRKETVEEAAEGRLYSKIFGRR